MCDFTLAVPEAKFGYTEVRVGFVPAIVSSVLVWQVGHKIARDLLPVADVETLPVERPHRFCLLTVRARPNEHVDQVVPPAAEYPAVAPA